MTTGGPAAPSPTNQAAGFPIATLTFGALLGIAALGQLLAGAGAFHLPPSLAFVPGRLFGGADVLPGMQLVPPPATLVTYQFIHVGAFHLLGNLACLWIFGPHVEDALGPGRWTVLLLACGIAAALVQAFPMTSSPAPLVGASGGIAGLLGAYLYLHPRAEFRPGWRWAPGLRLPVWAVLLAWFALQVPAIIRPGLVPGAAAFGAHAGGFACGLLLAPVLHFLALLSLDARPIARTRTSRHSSH